MSSAPNKLDGARVLAHTFMKTKGLGYVCFQDENGVKHDVLIEALSIAQYDNDRSNNSYYLFSCDENWNVIGDSLHYSLDEVFKCAENSYGISSNQWIHTKYMPYSYEDLERDLAIGHEVEFKYMGREYSITNNKAGWYLSEPDSKYQMFADKIDLLEKGTIDGKNLKDIWNDVEVTTIF
ncbi:hypothetical protein [Paenibacillus chitinolyticus]|uniref:hypothetical protein n=1 Tax=Paenibacillus chitinolyticus TaxID=79263 RepID=UPI003631E6BD